ncbi:MAG: nucleotide pyrophosphohydrolase [Clostridia bacterium]|nr:nucleotide pyrophosphohydrolase [Clostridia bacterium]
MELKEELELLNEKSSVAEIQEYIKDMKKARKFDGVTIEREMMLFLEELGELAKAIRKKTKGRLDIEKEYNTNVEEELADCFIYLLSIANMNNIDVFKAFKDKETKNCNRVWK